MLLSCYAWSNGQQNIKGIKSVSNRNRMYKINETDYLNCTIYNIIFVYLYKSNILFAVSAILFLYSFRFIISV